MGRIHDVAREAGVSITTVSHVFSGKRPVAPDTERRVRDVARRLGFSPHSVARGLATGRSMTLAIAFPFTDDSVILDPYFGRLLEGFSGAAAAAGYGFLLVPMTPRRSGFPLSQLLSEGRFDGAIVADPAEHDDLIPLLRRHGVPVVTTGRYRSGRSVPWVDNDNSGGMTRLVQHILDAGYERLAMVSMTPELSYTRDIDGAFRALVGDDAPIVRSDVTEEGGYRMALELLDTDAPPDAIVASSDRQALGVSRAARELGIEVPGELGIAGSGDTLAAHAKMTSISVQTRELGEAAVSAILSLLVGGEPPKGHILPTYVEVRQSTDRLGELRRPPRLVAT